ncbi:MAG: dihydroxyacetone kinase subunit L [Burkholderiaceae bacterium]|nr:dihydroxyacetone kinase subunit L [Burkholderiaceae bacterium]
MHSIAKEDLPALFEALRDVFVVQREALIALDGKVGDSDLGITMSKAFVAAFESVRNNATDPIGKTVQLAGMAVAKAAPSTMGTLVATGLMRGGKALEGVQTWGTAEMSAFWDAFLKGVADRGKAQLGDKTLLDVLSPIALSLQAAKASSAAMGTALAQAAQAARDGLEATKAMVAQHGKAACFQEKTIGLQDAGATVGVLIIETMYIFVVNYRRST